MPKTNSQKGATEVSTVAAVVIVAAVAAAISMLATSKYYEGLNSTAPIATATPAATPTPDATPTPTPIVDEKTTDWQTYNNIKYGFEVKYPINYSATEPNILTRWIDFPAYIKAKIEPLNVINFADPKKANDENSQIEITTYDNGNDYALEQWLAKYSEILPTNSHLGFREKEVIIDGVKGLKGGFGCCMAFRHSVFMKNGNKIYQIAGSFIDVKTETYTNEEMFDQMLSTFKFTEIGQIINWPTYSSPTMKYSVQYPSGWEVGKETPVLGGETNFIRTDSNEDISINFRYGVYYEQVKAGNILMNSSDAILSAKTAAGFDPLMEEKNITVAGSDAVQFKYNPMRAKMITNPPDLTRYEIYIPRNDGKIFTITAIIKTSKLETYEPIFQQILSTFKLTK
ncbi:MAG: PsbP-related protein [Janthinobacterium sp.]|jgi:hypothetical protein